MDSQGFVFLSVLTNFNRIKQLTSDIDLVRYVCLQAPTIELQTGADGIDRVRALDGWSQWVLSMEDREEGAKNDGPVQMHQPNVPQPQILEGQHASGGRNALSWRASFAATPSRMDDSVFHSLDGAVDEATQPFMQGVSQMASNGDISDAQITQTPLSAAVPDFAPGLPLLSNHVLSPLEPHTSVENSFSDEQVESLMIVIRKPLSPATPLTPPSLAAMRTFSNGSIDGRTISDELASHADPQSVSSTNGDHTSDR